MKYAVKKAQKRIFAYQLGRGSAMEQQLLQEGCIRLRPDGSYELFSQEAVNGQGEIAQAGDYFKVDVVEGRHYPYPNARGFFEANHRLLDAAQNLYEQKTRPLQIWQKGDPVSPELQFLLDSGRLQLHPDCPQRYFCAQLWGTALSAPEDATLLFYRVDRSADGTVVEAEFNFIAPAVFAQDYCICTAEKTTAAVPGAGCFRAPCGRC